MRARVFLQKQWHFVVGVSALPVQFEVRRQADRSSPVTRTCLWQQALRFQVVERLHTDKIHFQIKRKYLPSLKETTVIIIFKVF